MIYAMSDIHGCMDAFEEQLKNVDLSGDNRLVLLGDYIDYGSQSAEVLQKVYAMEQDFGSDKVIVLKGNHEDMLLSGMQDDRTLDSMDETLLAWVRDLRLFYESEKHIFVHAGIDERQGTLWRWGTKEALFLWKKPPTFGRFYKAIVAGHVGTDEITEDPRFYDIYYDGASHYFIDGSIWRGGKLNLWKYDENKQEGEL